VEFRENANNESLSGDLARHAGSSSRKLTNIRLMPLDEARALVRKVLFAWIDAR
jgi:hypothetical protein